MPHIGPRPPSLSTGNSKNSIRFFRIPFGGGIENPFEPHIPRGITNHVTRNFHRFPRSHAINILLLRPAVRLVCKVKPKFLCEMHFYKDFMSRKGHLFNFLRARSPATRGENAIWGPLITHIIKERERGTYTYQSTPKLKTIPKVLGSCKMRTLVRGLFAGPERKLKSLVMLSRANGDPWLILAGVCRNWPVCANCERGL